MPLTKVASSMLASGASGSGGSAGKNYISTYNNNSCNGDFESGSDSGWVSCQVSTITTGLPSGLTLNAGTVTRSLAPTAIAGQYSLQAVFPATANQGFISEIFTIDTEDQAKVLTFKFYYQVTAGASGGNFSGTSSNTFIVGIYAVNGSNIGWFQPAGLYSMTQSSGAGIATGTFQTYSDATQYRFAILCASAPSGPITVTFDDFQVGPLTAPIGAPVTDWQNFPSVAAGTLITGVSGNPSYGTTTVNIAQWRRVGGDMEIRWDYNQTTAGGSPGSGRYLFNLPAGYSIDTTKAPVSSSNYSSPSLGVWQFTNNGATVSTGFVSAYSSTQLWVAFTTQNGATGSSDGWGSGAGIATFTSTTAQMSLTAKVPIAGWSANVQMSNDTDTRIVAAFLSGDAPSAAANAPIIFPTVTYDTHGAYNTTTGLYTVPVAGFYRVSGFINGSPGSMYLSVYKGVSSYGNATYLNTLNTGNVTITVQCNAGDTLSLRPATTFDCASNSTLQIERLSGPSVIAATESVNASYWVTTTATVTAGNPFNFDGKDWDTHGAVTTGASWKFTAPISGKYMVTGYINPNSNPASAMSFVMRKNGSFYQGVQSMVATAAFGAFSSTIMLNAGEYIDIRPDVNYAIFGNASRTAAQVSYLQITRIGN